MGTREQDKAKIRRNGEAILTIVRENLGELKAMGKVPKRIFRTAVLDGNTCQSCFDANGKMSWPTVDDIDWFPGDDCEHGLECRCGYTADFLGPQ